MRWFWATLLGMCAVSCGNAGDGLLVSQDGEQVSATHSVVLAELFTSEGCSSCPPADDVLSQLVEQQPISNVEVLGLGEHVDYWDRLGWRDPFSSAAFSNRQSNYDNRVFHSGRVYTPQLVVDGAFEAIGSDGAAVRSAILRAAQASKASVALAVEVDGSSAARVNLTVHVPTELARHEAADVLLAVAEDHLVTNVQRGENRGRTLKHSAVARALLVVGALAPQDRMFSATVPVPLDSEWQQSALRMIGFVQERSSRRIIGAGSTALAPDVNTRTTAETSQ